MKIQKSEKFNIEYGSDVYINTYVSSWGGNVEVKLNGYQSGGDEHSLVIQLPLDKARALSKELSQDLENYDKEQAEKAQRELEEAKAQDEE
tara:strand:- start:655 stop:927 length:273 start_codon:yes stop_codon:yes gene_type:complete